MAIDDDLADRVRVLLDAHGPVEEKRMFGGLAFLVAGSMAVAASGRGGLMVRVEPDETARLLEGEGVEPVVMSGRETRGWVRVSSDVLADDAVLAGWVERGVARARAS